MLVRAGIPQRLILPGAFFTDGTRLYEVMALDGGDVRYENSVTGGVVTHRWAYLSANSRFRLVREAPRAPDTAAALTTQGGKA